MYTCIHIHIHSYTSLKKISDCLISEQWGSDKYHKLISVVVIELPVRCLNTGPEDILPFRVSMCLNLRRHMQSHELNCLTSVYKQRFVHEYEYFKKMQKAF